MNFKDIKTVFTNWDKSEDVTSNIYGVHFDDSGDKNLDFAVSMAGSINLDTAIAYTSKIQMFKNLKAVDFSIMGYENKEYGVGGIDLIQAHWNFLKSLISVDNLQTIMGKSNASESLDLTIVEITLNDKTYYFLSFQESSEKMYKKRKIYSVKNVLTTLKTNEFFTMTSDIDCIIDEEQKCFYALKNKNVIDMFGLETVACQSVATEIQIIDNWKFIENAEIIKKDAGQKNIYGPLFKIFNDKKYVEELKQVSPQEMKQRLIRVSKGQISTENFKDDKLVLSRKNRAYILDLLCKKKKYNPATDTVED